MTTIRAFTLFAACALSAAACTDSSGGGTGKLTVQLTDAPFPFSQVSRVDVFVVRIDAKNAETDATEAANATNMSGWTTLATPNALINLLDLGGGKTTNLGEVTLATGTYRGFRLIIDPAQSSLTLKDGTQPSVVWPSAARTGIKIVLDAPVSLTENGSVLVVDFDVGRSFVMRGNSVSQNGLLFKPVVRGTAVDITGSASGSVHGDNATGPAVVGATVEVLKTGTPLTDTDDANIVASTTTDASGNFKFGFLLPGTYVLRATPPSGSVYTAALLSGGLTITTAHETSGLVVVLGH
jgi:hypothetical protein